MCRFIAYLGKPIMADELLIKPKNSLLMQSHNALETSMPVNGDGFGIGWYNNTIRKEPALYRSIRPAWNDENLSYNASMIKTKCLIAHVRAATQGGVSLENSHPFRFKEFLMMQNGGIKDFVKIKRKLINRLNDEAFEWINGQTDTQYIFALFMTIVHELKQTKELVLEDLATCFSQTFAEIEEMKKTANLDSPSLYNMVLTNGEELVATRYSTHPDKETRSLHLASNADCYICDKGFLRIKESEVKDFSVLISSEVLTDEKAYWQIVPENHIVIINKKIEVQIKPLS